MFSLQESVDQWPGLPVRTSLTFCRVTNPGKLSTCLYNQDTYGSLTGLWGVLGRSEVFAFFSFFWEVEILECFAENTSIPPKTTTGYIFELYIHKLKFDKSQLQTAIKV